MARVPATLPPTGDPAEIEDSLAPMRRLGSTVLAIILLLNARLAIALPAGYESRVREYIETEMAALGIPGAAVVIVEKDEIVFAQGFGMAGRDQAVTPGTPFILLLSANPSRPSALCNRSRPATFRSKRS